MSKFEGPKSKIKEVKFDFQSSVPSKLHPAVQDLLQELVRLETFFSFFFFFFVCSLLPPTSTQTQILTPSVFCFTLSFHVHSPFVEQQRHFEHKTNNWVQSKIIFLVDPQEPLLATSDRWKLAWFRHFTHRDSLSRTILQGILRRVGDTVVGRGKAGWTKSKNGHPCPCQNCSQGLLQKRLEEDLW